MAVVVKKVHSNLYVWQSGKVRNFSSHPDMAKSREKVQIHGFCDPDYGPVRERVEQMLHKGTEENLQLCVYVNGECVIDLAGTAKGNSYYNEDTLQVCLFLE